MLTSRALIVPVATLSIACAVQAKYPPALERTATPVEIASGFYPPNHITFAGYKFDGISYDIARPIMIELFGVAHIPLGTAGWTLFAHATTPEHRDLRIGCSGPGERQAHRASARIASGSPEAAPIQCAITGEELVFTIKYIFDDPIEPQPLPSYAAEIAWGDRLFTLGPIPRGPGMVSANVGANALFRAGGPPSDELMLAAMDSNVGLPQRFATLPSLARDERDIAAASLAITWLLQRRMT